MRVDVCAAAPFDARLLRRIKEDFNPVPATPSPFIYKTQISRNLVFPKPLLFYILAISLLPSHALNHINHTTTLFLYTTTLFLSQSAKPFVTDTKSEI